MKVRVDVPGDVGEQLAGCRGIGPEKLINEQDSHADLGPSKQFIQLLAIP